MTARALASTAVFIATYFLLAAPRTRIMPIGRPAAALVGAVLMVLVGALTPSEAYAAIDGNTLVLLVALMAFSGYLEQAGLFARLSDAALHSELSPSSLLVLLVFVSGGLSAILLNDTVCVFLTPIVCSVCVRRGLPLGPYLLALATSSNIGSAATLIGNPQNILIGSVGPLGFIGYARAVAPAALLGLAADAALLLLCFRKALRGPGRVQRDPRAAATALAPAPLVVGAALVAAYAAGLHLAFSTLTAVAVLVIIQRREPRTLVSSVDWPLIVFFASLFVVVEGFAHTGFPEAAWALAAPHLQLGQPHGVSWFTGYTLLGSNLFSNVPLVMLTAPLLAPLQHAERGFALLGFVSTVAGNFTLLGSVANLIVAERARQHYELGFFEYLRFGVLSTAVVLAIGVPLVCLLT